MRATSRNKISLESATGWNRLTGDGERLDCTEFDEVVCGESYCAVTKVSSAFVLLERNATNDERRLEEIPPRLTSP